MRSSETVGADPDAIEVTEVSFDAVSRLILIEGKLEAAK
jgi:hypothetical protein